MIKALSVLAVACAALSMTGLVMATGCDPYKDCPEEPDCSTSTCKVDDDCCVGICISGTCLAECPTIDRGPTELKACIDTEERPGQATCGLPTCAALCDAVCPEQVPEGGWRPQDCDNRGGGNCQGVTSALTGVPFQGGPCCGCTACGPKGFNRGFD